MSGKKGNSSGLIYLRLGSLPVDAINHTLELELDPGEVVFSINAQIHARRRHPEDFPKFSPYIGSVVSAPLFVGNDFKNKGNIELISRITSFQTGLLVAVAVQPDVNNVYHIRSFYPVSEKTISSRLDRGFLKRTYFA